MTARRFLVSPRTCSCQARCPVRLVELPGDAGLFGIRDGDGGYAVTLAGETVGAVWVEVLPGRFSHLAVHAFDHGFLRRCGVGVKRWDGNGKESDNG